MISIQTLKSTGEVKDAATLWTSRVMDVVNTMVIADIIVPVIVPTNIIFIISPLMTFAKIVCTAQITTT